ncbi:multinuclear nonheme iron-dependent oxidase [Roseateles chitinivorans]|uniref:multinuclear nonheme iron-dependent oxidase n=1 Tax=Roseateles chitinivorans TaxID=2917965 RepID=UPI003D669E79
MRRGAALWPVAVGIGWRQPHYREVLGRGTPDLDFLEVHTENFLAPGGASRQLLLDAARRFPISLHGTGLGLGSAAGIDTRHLQRVRALVDAVKPAVVSEHAGFARARHRLTTVHAHEQLPIPFSERGLSLLASHVDAVQQGLGRQILIENLSAYLAWEEDAIHEADFFNALAGRTGCGLLLDLNSLFVNALNRGLDDESALKESLAWLDAVNPAVVGQYHLSGHSRMAGMVVADHGGAVGEPVWSLYRHALAHIGARPTLIEWDHALPPLATLCGEVARARTEQAAFDREQIAPPPPRPSSRGERLQPEGQVAARERRRTAPTREIESSAADQDLAVLQSGLMAALLTAPGASVPSGSSNSSGSAGSSGSSGPSVADTAPPAPVGLRAPAGIVGGLPRALRAYQAHVSAQADRALAAVYPRLRDRVEADQPGSFASLAWACWRRHPPVDGDLGEWGEALIGLLAGAEAQGLPPLWTALARIEWELHRVARLADPQPDLNSLALLGRLPAGAVRLVLADHVALHGERHPVRRPCSTWRTSPSATVRAPR